MTKSYTIQQVMNDWDRKAYLRFPYHLYRSDPNWIPRLWPEQLAWLRRSHGFFEHGEAEWFILRDQHQILGTIGVAIDPLSNQHLGRQDAIFGFIEFWVPFNIIKVHYFFIRKMICYTGINR